jgi:hypothetical protein
MEVSKDDRALRRPFFGRHADICSYEHDQACLSHGRREDLY